MKLTSLCVCFFICLQIPINTIENDITSLETQVADAQYDDVSSISKACAKLYISLEKKQQTLSKRSKTCHDQYDKIENELTRSRSKYELMKKQGSILLCEQQKQDQLSFDLVDFDDQFQIVLDQYQSIKFMDRCLKLKCLYYECGLAKLDQWMSRLENCQEALFGKFDDYGQYKFDDTSERDNGKIQGNVDLPVYGSVDDFDSSSLSCLVDGHYEIDTYSTYWQFPIENGRISAGTWAYPSGGMHLGLDVAASLYSEVHAPTNGLILYANACVDANNGYLGNWCGWPNGGGNTICMICAINDMLYAVSFCHLSDEIYVKAGQQVHQGDIIALSGNSGNSTGPHTHIEIIELNIDLDTAVDYFLLGADFSFGTGYDQPATCSAYGCRLRPENVLEVS